MNGDKAVKQEKKGPGRPRIKDNAPKASIVPSGAVKLEDLALDSFTVAIFKWLGGGDLQKGARKAGEIIISRALETSSPEKLSKELRD